MSRSLAGGRVPDGCVSAPARCRGDGSDSGMAASMFYGRQLAAAALRSHRPQTTLRAAAQVSRLCLLQPRRSADGTRAGCGALRGAGTSGVPCGAQSCGCRPGLPAGGGGSAPARVLGRPGMAPWLPASPVGAPRGAWAGPAGGLTLPVPFWVRGMPFKCTFLSRELSWVGRTSEHRRSRPAYLPQTVAF